jgi:hypothetical protein
LKNSERLGSAALVCIAWREAANAATSSISHTCNWADRDSIDQRLNSITAWLERNTAQHITVLNLDSRWGEDEDDVAEVPLPLQQLSKLRSLKLILVELLDEPLLGNSSTSISSSTTTFWNPLAAMSSSLTALELYDVTLHSFSSMQKLFGCMASLSKLQRLELTSVRVEPQATEDEEEEACRSSGFETTLATALFQMPQLTRLLLNVQTECQLRWQHSPGSTGAAIAGMQQLQQLDLSGVDAAEAAPHIVFTHLPASITHLHVSKWCFTCAGLSRLPATHHGPLSPDARSASAANLAEQHTALVSAQCRLQDKTDQYRELRLT